MTATTDANWGTELWVSVHTNTTFTLANIVMVTAITCYAILQRLQENFKSAVADYAHSYCVATNTHGECASFVSSTSCEIKMNRRMSMRSGEVEMSNGFFLRLFAGSPRSSSRAGEVEEAS